MNSGRAVALPRLKSDVFVCMCADLALVMQQLPDVLAQLVMQCLPIPELLQFARCNRRLFSQSDSAFAFKLVPQLTRSWSMDCSTLGLKHLCHAPITLKPRLNSAGLDALIACLPSRLYGFDAADANLFPSECVRLLSHPSMKQLRTLWLRPCFPWFRPEVAMAMVRLPALHTISLLEVRPSVESLRILALAPALTSIDLQDTASDAPSILAGLVDFPSLKRLTVRQPWIYDEQWVQLFASPGLCKLTSLTLNWCGAWHPGGGKPISPEFAASVFTSLLQLTSLYLRSMRSGVDPILPALRCALALTRLSIEASPSFPLLHQLLLDQPSLRISVAVPYDEPARDVVVATLSAQFAGVAPTVRSRLTVGGKSL